MTIAATRPNRRDQQKVGDAVEFQRPPDVDAFRFAAAAFAHEHVVDHDAAIAARPGKRQAERAGHRRFRPAGIGRAVFFRVAPHGTARHFASASLTRNAASTISSAVSRDAGRLIQIVEACRCPAEGLMARGAVADHRNRRCWRPCRRRRRPARRRRSRRRGRRCRRKNSRPGFRSPRG